MQNDQRKESTYRFDTCKSLGLKKQTAKKIKISYTCFATQSLVLSC
jgi:hypothetical protein